MSQKDKELKTMAIVKIKIPGISVASANIIGKATIPAPNNAFIVLFVVEMKDTEKGSKRQPGATDSKGAILSAFHKAALG